MCNNKNNNNMTKYPTISFNNQFQTVSITTKDKDCETLQEFIDYLIVPLLKAVGYTDKTIEEYIESDFLGF